MGSCSNPYEDIVFVDIENAQFQTISQDKLELVADCILYNPNKVGLELREADFKVFVNDKEAAQVTQEENTMMPGREQFTFPIKVDINPKELYGKKGKDAWNIAAQILINREIGIKYMGKIKAGKGMVSIEVPIVDSLKVPIKW
jgi:LEA14-like dessication related protein